VAVKWVVVIKVRLGPSYMSCYVCGLNCIDNDGVSGQ